MNANAFRKLALALPQATEGAHMNHPDFRVRGKIYATLGPDGESAMVKLTPAQQALYVCSEPDVYTPASGAWGRQGSTMIRLSAAKASTLRQALVAAWRNTAPKRLAASYEEDT